MLLKIASRKSDLARMQAMTVARKIKEADNSVQIEHEYTSSLGDQNLDVPLWTMGDKGVFTKDFFEKLKSGAVDMVVHSWKDLPIEDNEHTYIAATIEREDMRDVLLVSKDVWKNRTSMDSFRVMTSSPRRQHNLEPHLAEMLPHRFEKIEFVDVRGNIPTRVDKLLAGHGDGLLIAKAALDRMLSVDFDEFTPVKEALRGKLNRCHFMVLPLSINPPAAAQGALAIEIKRGRKDLESLLNKIHDKKEFDLVQWERNTLASYGGGCHQKIGVAKLARDYGEVEFLKGLTDQGQVLNEARVAIEGNTEVIPLEKMWSPSLSDRRWFKRNELTPSEVETNGCFVARAEAWVEALGDLSEKWVWTSGIKSWKKLAAKGIWVHGCTDGLGEQEDPMLNELAGEVVEWTKVTHKEGVSFDSRPVSATYELIPEEEIPDLSEKTHFFWMSGSAFLEARKKYSHIDSGFHGCGPGHTYEVLKKYLPDSDQVRIYLNERQWLKSHGHLG